MIDVRLIELASRQHRCVARWQLLALGYSDDAIVHRIAAGRLVPVFHGVYAVAPLLDDSRMRWMAATLTTSESVLSHASAGGAWGYRWFDAPFEIVTRHGNGGPEQVNGVLVCRSASLAGNTTTLDGIPITTQSAR